MANEHKHGEMDISVQEKTFEGFIKAATWTAAGSLAFLVFLAIVNV
ncbi:MAG: aa3-type cytochrome c oxidase subunit IV [Roseovarius sp.]